MTMLEHAHQWDDSEQKVEAWRLHVLLEAGYPLQIAERLAVDTAVDLHGAVELVERGCRPAIAALILL